MVITSIKYLLAVVCLMYAATGMAQPLKVAAAANLHGVITALQADFKKQTGIKTEIIIGSSGKLMAQMGNGAPYDIFLSADMKYPETLYKQGFAVAQPAVYALGKLIICSNQNLPLKNWKAVLLSGKIKHLAIANPALAPYGKAAEETLAYAGILEKIKTKLVYGESVAQVNTYIVAGAADIAFTTRAFLYENKKPKYWQAIDTSTYSPIQQGIILLKHAAGNPAANKFYNYILSSRAKRIFKRYGYN